MAKRVRSSSIDKVNITLSFTRKGLTEPESDDIFHLSISKGLYNDYLNGGDPDIMILLEELQENCTLDLELSEFLNNPDSIRDIAHVRLSVSQYDGPFLTDYQDILLRNIYKNLKDEFKRTIEGFSIEHNVSPRDEFNLMKQYIEENFEDEEVDK